MAFNSLKQICQSVFGMPADCARMSTDRPEFVRRNLVIGKTNKNKEAPCHPVMGMCPEHQETFTKGGISSTRRRTTCKNCRPPKTCHDLKNPCDMKSECSELCRESSKQDSKFFLSLANPEEAYGTLSRENMKRYLCIARKTYVCEEKRNRIPIQRSPKCCVTSKCFNFSKAKKSTCVGIERRCECPTNKHKKTCPNIQPY